MLAVTVPDNAQIGQTVTLTCVYDLQEDRLDVLKWHLNGREFYRFYGRPLKKIPQKQIFPLPGVDVDVSNRVFRHSPFP